MAIYDRSLVFCPCRGDSSTRLLVIRPLDLRQEICPRRSMASGRAPVNLLSPGLQAGVRGNIYCMRLPRVPVARQVVVVILAR